MKEFDKSLVILFGVAALISVLGLFFTQGNLSITGMAYNYRDVNSVKGLAIISLSIAVAMGIIIISLLLEKRNKK